MYFFFFGPSGLQIYPPVLAKNPSVPGNYPVLTPDASTTGYLELFAGKAGLSREIERLCGNFVEVMRPLDVMEDWDILTEEGFEKAKSAHTTPTWPSLTSSKSRWTWVSACDSIGRSTGRLGALHGRRGKPRPRESDRPDLLDRGGGQNVVPAECHMPGNSRR